MKLLKLSRNRASAIPLADALLITKSGDVHRTLNDIRKGIYGLTTGQRQLDLTRRYLLRPRRTKSEPRAVPSKDE